MIDHLLQQCDVNSPEFRIAAPVLNHVAILHDRLPGYTELSCFDPTKQRPPHIYWSKCSDHAELARIAVKAASDNLSGYGLYIGIASRKAPTDSRGFEKDAEHIRVLWADVDCKNGGTLEQVLDFEPTPSIVFSSGGGFHPYWILSYGVTPTQHHKDIMRGIARRLKGDNVGDFARVFRCLGSYNTKPGRDNRRVLIERYDPELVYNIEDFAHLAEPEQVRVVRNDMPIERTDMPAWVAHLRDAPPATERNNTLFRIASSLHNRGWDIADVASEFMGFGGLPEAESIRTIQSAFNRPRRGQAISSRDDLRAAARA